MNDDATKREFLNQEVWLLTFHGGLGRTGVYKKETHENDRTAFRVFLRNKINLLVQETYTHASQTSDKHCATIATLKDEVDRKFGHLFKENNIPIGIIQKILNLHLKYLWCLDWIPIPPHFPVDAIMLAQLPRAYRELRWSRLNDMKSYRDIIEQARQLAGATPLAEWELRTFSRRGVFAP